MVNLFLTPAFLSMRFRGYMLTANHTKKKLQLPRSAYHWFYLFDSDQHVPFYSAYHTGSWRSNLVVASLTLGMSRHRPATNQKTAPHAQQVQEGPSSTRQRLSPERHPELLEASGSHLIGYFATS